MPASIIIPAYNSAPTVGETVAAARRIAEAPEAIVVDDGSRDDTAEVARGAGANQVVVLPRNVGKGGALAAGLKAARQECVLFLDADLGNSAHRAEALLEAIAKQPGMAIAVFPRLANGEAGAGKLQGPGGFGLARGLAAATIRLLSGIRVAAPLSGQRALPAGAARHVGLAAGFAVETALTVELAHLGLPIIEIPLPLQHHLTGRTLSGFLHRGKQFRDILQYGLLITYGLGWPALSRLRVAVRILAWSLSFAVLIALGVTTSPSASPLLAAAALCGVMAWLPCLWTSAVWLRLRKPNHLGRSLPAAAGMLFPLVGLPTIWFCPLGMGTVLAGLIVIGAFGAVGLLDDLFAAHRQARGLAGHVRALLRGRLTTGLVKAAGGIAAGLAAGALLSWGDPGLILVDALLISLSANFINLLDLRPSRALKGFGLMCALAILAWPGSLHLVGPMLALAIVAAPAEFAGRLMLGDVGANVLGGIAGLGMAVAFSPWQRLLAVGLLAGFHLFCERFSFSALVERNRVLRELDRIGTSHLPPLSLLEVTHP